MKKGGYFAAQPLPGLTVLSLNINYWATMNSQISSNTTLAHAEGLAQFAWLAAELAAAAARNDAVHILGHQYGTIPPAFSYLMLVPPPRNRGCLRAAHQCLFSGVGSNRASFIC